MFEILKKNLISRGFAVSTFATKEEANAYLNEQVDGVTVGAGGSVTLAEMGLLEALDTHNEVFWHQKAKTPEESQEIRLRAANADVYFSSANGIAETGEIINIDGNGNRVSSTIWGHKKVYLVIGKNKIAPDYDSALWRARNIAGPKNAQRLNKKTPCAVKGDKCYDCKSPERICRALSVFWEKPTNAEYEVVLINEDLGY